MQEVDLVNDDPLEWFTVVDVEMSFGVELYLAARSFPSLASGERRGGDAVRSAHAQQRGTRHILCTSAGSIP